jgi:GT2 family glycosyltransferase
MSVQHPAPNIAVVLHLSNPALWPSYWESLQLLPHSTTFFVSTTLDKKETVQALLHQDLPHAQLFAFEGRGRDFGALVSLLKLVQLDSFDWVLKLHTGNTEFYSDTPNDQWLMKLVRGLVPNGRLSLVFDFLQKNTSVGFAGPHGQRWPLKKLFYNENTVKQWNQLTSGRSQSDFPQDPFFMAGGMFWARGSVFKGFANLKLDQNQFEVDSPELDGTLAHVLERFVCLIAHDQSLTVEGFDFSDFSQWVSQRVLTVYQRRHFETFIASNSIKPLVQIIVRCPSNSVPDVLAQSLQSIQAATLCGMKVEAHAWHESDSIDLASFANHMTQVHAPDFLMIMEAGDVMTPSGLLMLYVEVLQQPEGIAFYTDKMLKSRGGSIETAFLPDFNHDLLVSFPWLMSNHWLFKRDLVQHLGGFDPSAGRFFELAFIFKLLTKQGHAHIHHLAEPLLTTSETSAWLEEPEERALVEQYVIESGYPNGQVLQMSPRLYRALYLQAEAPLVSLIIPNQGFQLTQRCMESLLQNTGYTNYEILIVDNHSQDPASLNWLQGIAAIDPQKFRIVDNEGPTNIYAMNNLGARTAHGELLVFVDPCLQFIEASWLDSLVIHGQRPQVGAVGVKLVDSDLNVRSAGYILGMKPGQENAFAGEKFDDIGYLQRLSLDQNYMAVSSECVMVRASVFDALGGFHESPNRQSEIDIDFCLRLKAQGFNVVWTPHAVVQWRPSTPDTKSHLRVTHALSDSFLSRWLPAIANDPAYNKNLSLIAAPYNVEPLQELNWRPLTWRPQPVFLAHPSDDTGCGQYRVIKPLSAMQDAGIGDGVISFRHLLPSELERIQPDTVIFQRPLAREFLAFMKHTKSYAKAFKVYEIDDLINNIPIKNYFKSAHPKDTVKLLREGISHVDRLVVSTPGLAEAYANWHPEIQILELKLPPAWWGQLQIQRTEHAKPRVGWAGGSSHLGDLELIADVVKELANEVDWVFFGMCPAKLRPYVKEFHSGVPIHVYPQKLASLDLDLAVAPLESNPFNDCKSNLRLLEYGICGYPVVCSNVRAYVESGLPVQPVKNRYKDWVEAIRAHINDLAHTRQLGRQLQQNVLEQWMLEGDALMKWQKAWLPN